MDDDVKIKGIDNYKMPEREGEHHVQSSSEEEEGDSEGYAETACNSSSKRDSSSDND